MKMIYTDENKEPTPLLSYSTCSALCHLLTGWHERHPTVCAFKTAHMTFSKETVILLGMTQPKWHNCLSRCIRKNSRLVLVAAWPVRASLQIPWQQVRDLHPHLAHFSAS